MAEVYLVFEKNLSSFNLEEQNLTILIKVHGLLSRKIIQQLYLKMYFNQLL